MLRLYLFIVIQFQNDNEDHDLQIEWGTGFINGVLGNPWPGRPIRLENKLFTAVICNYSPLRSSGYSVTGCWIDPGDKPDVRNQKVPWMDTRE